MIAEPQGDGPLKAHTFEVTIVCRGEPRPALAMFIWNALVAQANELDMSSPLHPLRTPVFSIAAMGSKTLE